METQRQRFFERFLIAIVLQLLLLEIELWSAQAMKPVSLNEAKDL
jgi:hypothetical protein